MSLQRLIDTAAEATRHYAASKNGSNFLTSNFSDEPCQSSVKAQAAIDERLIQEAQQRAAALEANIAMLDAITTTTNNGTRYIPLQKAGALRNGCERGDGTVTHAVERVGARTWYDNESALCGTYPSIMWREASDSTATITCPRCVRKLSKLIAEAA